MENINKITVLRKLLVEFATNLSENMTFNQIAKVLFEAGIIDSPERPYGNYNGPKTQYVLEKLIAAQDKDGFPEMLSQIYFALCWDEKGPYLDDDTTLSLMEALGYESKEKGEPGWDPFLKVPEKILDSVLKKESSNKGRIVLENLPSNLESLMNELNDNLERNNLNASALLIRKILTLSGFIALDKVGKSNLIENKELSDVLSIVQKEYKISERIMAKVRSSKWIGDTANHSYKIKINDSDVEVAATGLRIFLGEIL